ncbi:MAG: hypothetical protein LBP33_06130 [Candidatus Adiutrix sp.]|jgi:hypothetical protein|nr:hypothetical protein [Candidatus Adiutrix sp.]
MEVSQPRHRNEDGKYVGLRAIRCLTVRFFEWLDLGPMLAKERSRASLALKKRLAKYGRSLKDAVKRSFEKLLKSSAQGRNIGLQTRRPASQEISRPWYDFYNQKIRAGLDIQDARRLTNEAFGYPLNWSPGYGDPADFVQ